MVEALLLVVLLFVFQGMPLEIRFTVLVLWAVFALPGLLPLFRGGPPFAPTPMRVVRSMIKLAGIKKGEKVYDIGCGDGRLVFAAAKKGAKAVGYEISIPIYLIAKIRSFSHPRSTICFGDFWKRDFHDADVIVCFLMPKIMKKFHAEIWPQLHKGARVVSHSFQMKNMKPSKKEGGAYLYVKK